jgi:hypothetical protein
MKNQLILMIVLINYLEIIVKYKKLTLLKLLINMLAMLDNQIILILVMDIKIN